MHVTEKRHSKLKIGCPVVVRCCPMRGYNLYLFMLSKHDCSSCCLYFPEMNLINCCSESNDTLYSIILCEDIYLGRIILKNKYPNLYNIVRRKHTLWQLLDIVPLNVLHFRRTLRTSLQWNGWPGRIRTPFSMIHICMER